MKDRGNQGDKGDKGKQEVVDAVTEFLNTDSVDKAFKSQDVLNAIRMIILADEEIMANVMRYSVPDRRFAVAAASYYTKCRKHSDRDGEEELKLLLGLLCSIGNTRINKLVEAVIGEQRGKDGDASMRGFQDKIKKFAFGD